MRSVALSAAHANRRTFHFKGSLAGQPCELIFDTGAEETFADADWLEQHGFKGKEMADPMLVITATNHTVQVTTEVTSELCLGVVRAPIVVKPLKNLLQGVQIIVGMDWMQKHSGGA